MPDLKHLRIKGTTYDIKDDTKVENIAFDSVNRAITKTIDGNTTNVVSLDDMIGADVAQTVEDWLDEHGVSPVVFTAEFIEGSNYRIILQ